MDSVPCACTCSAQLPDGPPQYEALMLQHTATHCSCMLQLTTQQQLLFQTDPTLTESQLQHPMVLLSKK
jgi:hypothetical protein